MRYVSFCWYFTILMMVSSTRGARFECTLGERCTLDVYTKGMPPTPSFRISDSACGVASTSALFVEVSPFVRVYVLSAVVDPALALQTLYICLMSSGISDPNYSISWGTVTLIGPENVGTISCQFGSSCIPVVAGSRLINTPSVLFYSTSNSCPSIPDGPAYGLHNDPLISIEPSTGSPYLFRSFGVVDASLASVTDLTLCWAAGSILSYSTPISIGTIELTGPTSRSLSVVCYMGFQCTVSGIDGSLSPSSSLIISDSPLGCDSTALPLTWPGLISMPLFSSGTYDFGSVTAVNDEAVIERPLCYAAGLPDDVGHLVNLGNLTMVGPSRSDNEFPCLVGVECTISINGVFDDTESSVSLRTGDCSGALVSLEINTGVYTSNPSSAVGTTGITASAREFSIGSITYSVTHCTGTTIAVCWESSLLGASRIQAGTLVLYGERNLPSTFTCTVGSSCNFGISVTLPSGFNATAEIGTQRLKLVEYQIGTETDPCNAAIQPLMSTSAAFDVVTNTVPFSFASMNKPGTTSSGFSKIVCWSLSEVDPFINISNFELLGPTRGINTTCSLGSECQISTGAYAGQSSANRLFLAVSDTACEMANSRSVLTNFRGPSVGAQWTNPSSTFSNGIYSFGILLGWTSSAAPPSLPVTYTVCYSAVASLHRSSVLGTVAIDNLFAYLVPSPCTMGNDCTIEVTSSSASAMLGISPSSWDCADLVYPSDYVAIASSSGGVQTFTIPQIPSTKVGISSYLCYYLSGVGAVNLGTMTVSGISITSPSPMCARGASSCSIAISPQGPIISPSVFLSQSISACAISESVVNTNNGASLTWITSANAIAASPGIAITAHTSLYEFGLCFQSASISSYVVIATLSLHGPFQTNAIRCRVGTSCMVALANGYFDPSRQPGMAQIALAPSVDLSSALGSNPCHNLNLSTVTMTGVSFPVVEDSSTQGVFNLGVVQSTAEITSHYTICWIHDSSDLSADYVPAGSLTLSGPSATGTVRCYTTLPCDFFISVTDEASALSNSVAMLVDGDCGSTQAVHAQVVGIGVTSPSHPDPGSATASSLTFRFGTITSTTAVPLNVCWGPASGLYLSATTLASVPVWVGIIEIITVN